MSLQGNDIPVRGNIGAPSQPSTETGHAICARPVFTMSSDQFKSEPTWQNIILKIIQGEALQMLPQYSGVGVGHALEISEYLLLGLEEHW